MQSPDFLINLKKNIRASEKEIKDFEKLLLSLHNEYLKFVEFNNKNQHDYLGLSFIIKNGLIILIVIGYYYFHRTLRKTKESIKQTQEIIKKDSVSNSNEKVKSLDDFLSDDEINR